LGALSEREQVGNKLRGLGALSEREQEMLNAGRAGHPWARTLGTDAAAGNTLGGMLSRAMGYVPMPPAMPDPRQGGMLPIPSQAEVRRYDNEQLDWHDRSPDDPAFGDRRNDGTIHRQAHMDHVSARANRLAELIRAGKVEGSGFGPYDIEQFEAVFGPGTFRELILGK
jgi:hypothetical protein